MKVELIYERSCPNTAAARAQLSKALLAARLPPRWTEWEVGQPGAPGYVRGYGSPTILVNGRDVAESPPAQGGDCCRLYSTTEGLSGVPALSCIIEALRGASGQSP
jgi:hypothetical protein